MRNAPRWLVLLIDTYIILETFILSYIIRFNFTLNFDYSQLAFQLPFVLIIFLISFFITGPYYRFSNNKWDYHIQIASCF